MATKRRQGNNTAKTVAIVVAFVLVFAILAGVLAYLLGGFNNLLTDTYYFRAGDISVTGATVQDEKDRNKYIDDLTSDGLVKIAVNSTEDATAQLLVFVQAKDTDRRLDDLLEVQVNGVRYTAGNVVVKGDGAKDPAWREVILGDVKLNEGENVITIAGTSVGVDLEYIALCVPHGVKLTKLADAPVAESDEERLVVSPEETQGTEAGVSLVTRAIAREQYNTYGISPMALSAQIVTATVKDGLDNTPEELQKVTFEMAWKSTNSAAVTDFVTMVTTDNTATFTCLKAFGTQIVVTVKSVFDETKTASITLDYVKGFSAYSMLAATKNYNIQTVSGASKSYTVTEGAVITAHFANAETKHRDSSSHYSDEGSWNQMPVAFPFSATWGTGTVENKLTKINVMMKFSTAFLSRHGVTGSSGWSAEIMSADADGTTLKPMTKTSTYNDPDAEKWSQWGMLAKLSGYTNQNLGMNFGSGIFSSADGSLPSYLKDLDTATKPIEGTLTLTFQYGAAKTIKFYIDAEVEASSIKSLEVDHSGLLFYA